MPAQCLDCFGHFDGFNETFNPSLPEYSITTFLDDRHTTEVDVYVSFLAAFLFLSFAHIVQLSLSFYAIFLKCLILEGKSFDESLTEAKMHQEEKYRTSIYNIIESVHDSATSLADLIICIANFPFYAAVEFYESMKIVSHSFIDDVMSQVSAVIIAIKRVACFILLMHTWTFLGALCNSIYCATCQITSAPARLFSQYVLVPAIQIRGKIAAFGRIMLIQALELLITLAATCFVILSYVMYLKMTYVPSIFEQNLSEEEAFECFFHKKMIYLFSNILIIAFATITAEATYNAVKGLISCSSLSLGYSSLPLGYFRSPKTP